MSKVSTTVFKEWLHEATQVLISALSAIIFTLLDFLDVVMCIFYRFLDRFLEGKAFPCYCTQRIANDDDYDQIFEVDKESELSESLYRRKNIFREMGLLNFLGYGDIGSKWRSGDSFVSRNVSRWSDCGCHTCVEWMSNGNDLRLHFVVKESSHTATSEDCKGGAAENVIFLHGFISSSSIWEETVFGHLSESTKQKYRLFAVDLLGFGKSPKPQDCLYTLKDHLDMIEKSVIRQFQLESFHLVAHSMGCVIALALAAKYSESVKSITLVAPPYFPFKEDASLGALNQLAARRLWPPLLFGSSFMSWYEHLGRCVCFIICRNHKTWEWILKLLTCNRNVHFMITDITRHTHHSAWHTMHNVVCLGAMLMDGYLEVLDKARVKIHVVHGTRDQVVPLECSTNIEMKVPNTKVSIIENADHCSVILGREEEFTEELEHILASSADSIAETSSVDNKNC